MKKVNLYSLMCAVTLSACSSLPLPVVDTPNPDADKMPFGDISTFDNVKAKFKGYYLAYSEAAKDKRTSAQSASEVGFYGAVLGVVAGIAKDVNTAIGGGLIGSGAGLYNDRYKLQVQAQSYEVSADAMLCMYLASQDLVTRDIAEFNVGSADQSGDLAARDIAIDGLLRVRDKLYKLQTTFQLGTPDPNKLKDAVNAAKSSVTAKVLGVAASAARNMAESQLQVYKNQIDQCVAKTAG
jgi:hypothetical protein